MRLTVIQAVPAMDAGGVEKGVVQISQALCELGHRSIVVSNGGHMVEQLQAHGAEHVTMSIHSKSPLALMCVRPLRRLIRETRADVLHACSRMPAWVGYMAWRRMPANGRPAFVTSVHGLYSVSRYSRIMLAGQRVEVVSNTARDYVLNNYPGIEPSRLSLNYRGVAPDDFPFGYRPSESWVRDFFSRYPQLKKKFIVTLAGRVTRLKGHHDLIDTIAKLRDRGCDAHGLIVGGAAPRRLGYLNELHEAVRARGLADHITFTGHRDDVREVLAVSQAVLSLSTKPESFGLSVLEAIRLGRPVVAYDHGGVGEILSEVYPAGRVPFGDIDTLVGRLDAIHQGQLAPPAPTDAFLLSGMLDRTIGLYHSLAVAERPELIKACNTKRLVTR